jgi:hypothetical protein
VEGPKQLFDVTQLGKRILDAPHDRQARLATICLQGMRHHDGPGEDGAMIVSPMPRQKVFYVTGA